MNENIGNVKCIMFDFGGVFTDSPFHALTAYAKKIGSSEEAVHRLAFGGYGVDSDHPWHRVERGEISLEQAREGILALAKAEDCVVDIYEVFMAMAENGGGLRANLVEYVGKIRAAGYGTGIITNNLLELREHWRGMLPVDELFDFVIDSCEVGVRKPDPVIFEKALAHSGYAPEQVIFLDDFPGNVAAAEALQIHSILVDGDGEKTIKDLDRLLGLL